jgi:hypothetical protein
MGVGVGAERGEVGGGVGARMDAGVVGYEWVDLQCVCAWRGIQTPGRYKWGTGLV